GRVKPDLLGPDGVSSATYGSFAGCGPSGFSGTSAAAPHVAGALALYREREPSLNVPALESLLLGAARGATPAVDDSAAGAGDLLLPVSEPTSPELVYEPTPHTSAVDELYVGA